MSTVARSDAAGRRGADIDGARARRGAAERDGDYAQAVRLRYRAGLARLVERGALGTAATLRGDQLRERLSSTTFDELNGTFEAVAYGGRARPRPMRVPPARAGRESLTRPAIDRRARALGPALARWALDARPVRCGRRLVGADRRDQRPAARAVGPSGSVYATATAGTAAYGSLLTAYGHHVASCAARPQADRLTRGRRCSCSTRRRASTAATSPRFARSCARGGRLVAGGSFPQTVARRAPPRTTALERARRGDPARTVAEAAAPPAVTRVATAGAGSWSDPGGSTLALAGPAGGELALRGSAAAGSRCWRMSRRWRTGLLASADDAQLGLDLAGPRSRVDVFVETVHGFGGASGLGAIPSRWRWALIGLALAALLFAAAHARRLGAPDPPGRAVPPPRALYVQALAATLSRTRSPARAAEPVRTAAREILARVGGGEDPELLRATGGRCGLTAEEPAAVLDGPVGDAGALAAGRALARLRTLRR